MSDTRRYATGETQTVNEKGNWETEDGHTPACWAMPECEVCGLRKKPRGRDAGVVAANGYCGEDCEGYNREPLSGHLWPGETQ